MDEKIFTTLGLNAKEAKIYKAVLKYRRVTPTMLGKSTSIKRTTAYSIARGLVEKGLLIEDASKRPRIFSLASPQDIKGIITVEKKRLELREKILRQFAEDLSQAEVGNEYPVPRIRFIEEKNVEHFLSSQAHVWNESIMRRDGVWWGFQDHSYVEIFGHVIDEYWKQAPKELVLKLLSNQSEAESKIRGKFPRRTIKFWNKSAGFISTTWIVGDYVVMVNTRRRPFYLVEIHDATLANDLREVFKNLWALV